MATGVRERAVKFAVQHIKKNPGITMSELKALGNPRGINIYPLVIGLAKNELGMGNPKRKKAKRKVTRKTGRASSTGRPRGRPPRAVDPAAAITKVLDHVRSLEREVATLRSALSKISDIVGRT